MGLFHDFPFFTGTLDEKYFFCNASSGLVGSRVGLSFRLAGSNGVTSGWIKSKMDIAVDITTSDWRLIAQVMVASRPC